MRSVTSCFNPTLYRKTMLRFWPLWTAYGVFWLLVMPLNMINLYMNNIDDERKDFVVDRVTDLAVSIPDFLQFGVFLAAGFGLLCAMATFGYLYNNRSAGMMHTLPLRREGLFLTQYLAGISFWLLPQLVVAVVTAAMEMILIGPSSLPHLGIWLAVQSATSLFFYSFAVFCAMFTGHLVALPVFFGILNFLVIIIYFLISSLMEQFFYGFVIHYNSPMVECLTPSVKLSEACSWYYNSAAADIAPLYGYQLHSPEAVAAYAAAGAVLAVAALLVYRYRHVESAGDVVSVPLVRPIFKVGVAFCSGLCLGVFTALFFGWEYERLPLTGCILVWTAVGWFAAEMLLQKSFRVWKKWKGCLVMLAATALLCAVCFLDLLDIENRVPAPDNVAQLQVHSSIGYPYDEGRITSLALTEEEQIAQFTQLHRAILQERDSWGPGDDYFYLDLEYTLKNGTSMSRRYHSIPLIREEEQQEGTLTWMAGQLVRNPDLTALCYGFDALADATLVSAQINGIYDKVHQEYTYLELTPAQGQELWQAVQADVTEGTLGRHYLFEDQWEKETNSQADTHVYFEFILPEREGGLWQDVMATVREMEYTSIYLTPDARHALALLEENGIFGENARYSLYETD